MTKDHLIEAMRDIPGDAVVMADGSDDEYEVTAVAAESAFAESYVNGRHGITTIVVRLS
jgi:hypothetical protein